MEDEIRWTPAKFYQSTAAGPAERDGYQWRGLALRHHGWGVPRARTRWSLVHLGSGGTILRFTGDVATVFPVAGEIAECGDFTLFDLPEGWRQTDPDLPRKIAAICDAHPEARPDTKIEGSGISDDGARAVIAAREMAHDPR